MPGVVATEMMAQTGQGMFGPFAKDDPCLVSLLALYLVQAKADYLRGQLVNVIWDIEEMERCKEAIEKEKLLQVKWHPIIPIGGGERLSSTNQGFGFSAFGMDRDRPWSVLIVQK